jgi:hypothetical protein
MDEYFDLGQGRGDPVLVRHYVLRELRNLMAPNEEVFLYIWRTHFADAIGLMLWGQSLPPRQGPPSRQSSTSSQGSSSSQVSTSSQGSSLNQVLKPRGLIVELAEMTQDRFMSLLDHLPGRISGTPLSLRFHNGPFPQGINEVAGVPVIMVPQ